MKKVNLSVWRSMKIGRSLFKNPVMVSSGTFGYAEEFSSFIDLKKLGAIVTKTITLRPRLGNLPPRTCEAPAGMLNSIGLENPGLEVFLSDKLPKLSKYGVPIIVSISSEDDPKEFIELTRYLDKVKEVAAIELNISCPNLGKKALISQEAKATYSVVKEVRKSTKKTLITKLSPNVTSITDIASAAEEAGSDAVALINTITGMSIDVASRKPKLAMITGGLSGPAIRPIAVRMAWEVYQKIKIPIIGMGGITDTASALEFIIAGASAVSVGTANFVNPRATVEILSGIEVYLKRNKINSIKDLTGSLRC
ncbi:MAG: dihydroorotate dehydrogenase [Candidatus Omnitrophica bacterium]|nr:dihydroorotate dehydrogenase [Candidatus Omnitrophota bacterium]